MGSGWIVDGKRFLVPGLDVTNWLDDPRLRLDIRKPEDRKPGDAGDGCPRTTHHVRSQFLHTTIGENVHVLPGVGPATDEDDHVELDWRANHGSAGAHWTLDCDGRWRTGADLARECTYHCNTVNDPSIGGEIKQDRNGAIYEIQLVNLVRYADWVTRFRLSEEETDYTILIPRQLHYPYCGPLARMAAGGRDCVGFFGHRDIGVHPKSDPTRVVAVRGKDDPGDAPLQALRDAGYESFDYSKSEDIIAGKARQTQAGLKGRDVDGEIGRLSLAMFEKVLGKKYGLFVTRPGD